MLETILQFNNILLHVNRSINSIYQSINRSVGAAPAHPVLFALQVRAEAGSHLEELDDELRGGVVVEEERGRVVGADVASDVLVGRGVHQVPGQGAGLSQQTQQGRVL